MNTIENHRIRSEPSGLSETIRSIILSPSEQNCIKTRTEIINAQLMSLDRLQSIIYQKTTPPGKSGVNGEHPAEIPSKHNMGIEGLLEVHTSKLMPPRAALSVPVWKDVSCTIDENMLMETDKLTADC